MSRVSLVAIGKTVETITLDGEHICWVRSYRFNGQTLEILRAIPTDETAQETLIGRVRFKPTLERITWRKTAVASISVEVKDFTLHTSVDLDVENPVTEEVATDA